MVTTLIVTHGELARELLAAAEVIVGQLANFRAITLDWDDSYDEADRKIQQVLTKLDSQQEILILTDIYGGTPYNVAARLAEPGRIEVLTGVNLPMVVRLGCPDTDEIGVSELAEWIQQKARSSICWLGEGNGAASPREVAGPDSDD